MADFGDEMGDAIWRSLKTPFDEWFRCQIRRLVSGDSNLEPNFNKNGEAESYTLTFDSLKDRAIAMDVMKKAGIDFEKDMPKVTVQHSLKIKPEDVEKYQKAMEEYLTKIETGKYSPTHDETLANIRNEPAVKEYVEFAKSMELTIPGENPTFGDINKEVSANQRKIEKILNMREHGATAVEREAADRALDRVLSKEGLWKDWMKDEVNNLPDNLNIGQFCDQIAERGIGVDVAKGGGYQLYDPLNPHHRINLKNLDAKYSDEKLGLRSKETVSEEKTRESRDRTDRLSRERDLGEIGDKEIPSQQLITR